ncbi:MAG: rod-binding protein [Spirochaetia bacterium]|nr:rod-binding protein [Spirochaetia bacterium]
MLNSIDPFLYKAINYDNEDNKLNSINRQFANIEKNNNKFDILLKNKINENNKKLNLSTDIISKVPRKESILKEIKTNEEKRKLYEAAEQFEAYFVEKMFREMKKNIPKNNLINGGYAEEIFDEMLLTERVKTMAHNQEFGLAEMIYNQMKQI